jgi:hypothetical protein
MLPSCDEKRVKNLWIYESILAFLEDIVTLATWASLLGEA